MFGVSVIPAAIYKCILFKLQLHALLFLSNCLTEVHADDSRATRPRNGLAAAGKFHPSSHWAVNGSTTGGLLGRLLSLEAIKILSKPLHLIYGHVAIFDAWQRTKATGGESRVETRWDGDLTPVGPSVLLWQRVPGTWDRKESFILLAVCCTEVCNNRDVSHMKLIKVNFNGQIVIFLEPNCRNVIISNIYLELFKM